jgi:PST family polysaccharide transporter
LFEGNIPGENHTRTSLRGGAASVAARGINALVQIGSVVVLARLLTPEDYGLVAMVMAITGFAPAVVDVGTRDAIVQRSHISRGELSALFWFTMAVGTGCALGVAACAPLIAQLYGEPRLTAIVLVASMTFIACALSVQHHSLMRRNLMFQDVAVIEIVANLLSAVAAVTSAFLGARYWALLIRQLATPLFVAVGVWLKCRWVPSHPELTAGVKDSVRFGLNITGFTMTDFAGRSGDRITIGYRAGAVTLGHYQNALFVYDNLLDVLVFPLHSVAVASLAKMRHDLNALKDAWEKALSMVAFYAMPTFALLAVTSQDVVVLLLGEKWASAGVLLSMLALRGIPHSVERTLGWLHVTAGRSDRWLKWGIGAAAVQFGALLCGLPFGAIGIAVAFVVAMYVLFVPAIAYAGKPLGIGAADVIRVVWRQLVASLTAAGLAFLLRWSLLADSFAVTRTAILALACLLTYLIIVIGVFRVHAPLRITQALVRGYLPARLAHLV